MQHDPFHVYTVDQHILMVLRNVRRFFIPEHAHEYPFCSQLCVAGCPHPFLHRRAFHDVRPVRATPNDPARWTCAASAASMAWTPKTQLCLSCAAPPDAVGAAQKEDPPTWRGGRPRGWRRATCAGLTARSTR